jgi:hypothetical protein
MLCRLRMAVASAVGGVHQVHWRPRPTRHAAVVSARPRVRWMVPVDLMSSCASLQVDGGLAGELQLIEEKLQLIEER